eukprot:43781_1
MKRQNRNTKFRRIKTRIPGQLDDSYSNDMDDTQMSFPTATAPMIKEYEFKYETPLIGKYIKLKKMEYTDEEEEDLLMYQIQSITSPHEIVPGDKDDDRIPDLVQESTNQWLLLEDVHCNNTKKEKTQFSLAIVVIIIQILSYILLTYYLIMMKEDEKQDRREQCYGPNCDTFERACFDIKTGAVMSVLLLGFLWADFINTFYMIRDSVVHQLYGKLLGSIIILVELTSATVCGMIVAIYTPSDFEAINAAVGILFVHDLDEKIFAAMEVIPDLGKKLLALSSWIVLSLCLAMYGACAYHDQYWFGKGSCKISEFECGDGDCIWGGLVCDGNPNCPNGRDEKQNCNYSLIICPSDMFRCQSNGMCIAMGKRCNGILDCEDGSDEGRRENCSEVITDIDCGEQPQFIQSHVGDLWHLQISGGYFKCKNGQCIEGQHMCDGYKDCIDGSDEYPLFESLHKWPFLRECPYSKLIECGYDEVMCKETGQCISKMRVCDGITDCVRGEDERFCAIKWNHRKEFKCGQKIAKINSTSIILFENQTVLHYNSLLERSKLIRKIYYEGDVFYSLHGNVIPMHWRCDGIMDCEDGSDEDMCYLYSCEENEYECKWGKCIPDDWVCDGWTDCPYPGFGDEQDCSVNNIQNISCNSLVTGTITRDEHIPFHNYSVHIPCPYKAAQFTTCTNYTEFFNSKITVIDNYEQIWVNDDAGTACLGDYVASTITLTGDDFACNEVYTITVRGKYVRQTFGEYGLQVICSYTDEF